MARILTITLNPALDVTVSLETLVPGSVNRSKGLSTHAAGKGLNVAQVLADLGHSVTVSGFLGEANAQPFETLFAARGFTDAFIRVPGETRSNIKLAEQSGRVTDLNGPGITVGPAQQQQLLASLEQIAREHDAVIVAGSLAPGISVEWFAQLLQSLIRQGLRVALDTSGAALSEGLKQPLWLVKPNEHELAEACAVDSQALADLQAAARAVHARGVENVLLSLGADGVCWFADNIALHAQPPAVAVLSTVGAGDSLLGATVHGLLSGWPPERCLGLATAVAAQAVTQLGFGIQDREQLARIEAGVRVTPLANE